MRGTVVAWTAACAALGTSRASFTSVQARFSAGGLDTPGPRDDVARTLAHAEPMHRCLVGATARAYAARSARTRHGACFVPLNDPPFAHLSTNPLMSVTRP